MRSFIRYLPLYGCVSTGLVYTAVGVIALLSFFQVRDGGADESSMLAIANDYLVGKIFIVIILGGTLCYIIWRIYEAVTDPYEYGKNFTGILKRIGIALSTIADVTISYTAVRVLLGLGDIMLNGQPRAEQETVASILGQPWGDSIIVLIGMAIGAVAGLQFWYGLTRGYQERIDLEHVSKRRKIFTDVVAMSGYVARGIILGIIAFFLVDAGISDNASEVVNTDKAFDFIGDHVGHFYFILVACGTICYGVFMFLLGFAYDLDKD